MDTCCNCGEEGEFYHTCDNCNESLCNECKSHDWRYQLYNDPIGTMRYKGCMVVFDDRGVGKTYCMKCYKSKQ